ncbi:MAG TPA: FMN-binding protein [Dermatophilaceae bacterium]|nr:FMN-binding protein [Dermatophilaceae bacterium]
MRRIVTTILSTISIMVLLFSYHTSSSSATVSASPVVQQPASSDPNPPSGSSKSGGISTTRPGPAAKPSPAPAAIAYTGGVASTRWGPVQVRITVRGGKVTRAQAVQYPQGRSQDAQINSYALPILDQEVVQKQSASIDTISGATVTSDGYLQSLQSAIDQAHL